MAKTRKNRGSGFLSRLYSPVNRALQGVGNIGQEATSTVGNVFGRTVTGVRRVGNTVTGRVNQGVSELVRTVATRLARTAATTCPRCAATAVRTASKPMTSA
jgi:hypothetical protein